MICWNRIVLRFACFRFALHVTVPAAVAFIVELAAWLVFLASVALFCCSFCFRCWRFWVPDFPFVVCFVCIGCLACFAHFLGSHFFQAFFSHPLVARILVCFLINLLCLLTCLCLLCLIACLSCDLWSLNSLKFDIGSWELDPTWCPQIRLRFAKP